MRRTIVLSAACAAILITSGCAGPPAAAGSLSSGSQNPESCAPVTSTDLNTRDGWLDLIARTPETVSLVIDDGRGRTVEHRANEQQPLASAVKVVHLGAYARAVASGILDPDEQISLLEWERWYVPGSDGRAHPTALDRLGIANDGTAATDATATVRLDDMVTAMIQESDNAVPDYLRHRLGADALVDAAATGGWSDFEAPSLAAAILILFNPPLAEEDPWDIANRWAFDEQFRIDVGAPAQFPSYEELMAGVKQHSSEGSAAQLNSMYRSFGDGSFGEGSDTVLRQLEYQPAPHGAAGLGFKGGNLPGVLTQAFELRREDGTKATAVWLTEGLLADRYQAATAGVAHQQALIIEALDSLDVLDRIACVV